MRPVGAVGVGRRGRRAPVVTGVLTLSGLACLGLAVTAEQRPRAPSLSTTVAIPDPARPSVLGPPSSVEAVPTPQPSAPDAQALDPLAVPAGPASAGSRPAPVPAGPKVVEPVLPASAPLTVSIPAIGVQSQLMELGLAANGSMEVPPPGPRYDDAGWYRHSPTPGSLGPAVIAGHVDSAAGGPSVFFDLSSLAPQDTVSVTRADGSVAVFAVDDVQRFPKESFPTELVYGDTDHAALRLVTCGGEFDRASGHYLDNIVVTASLLHGTDPVAH